MVEQFLCYISKNDSSVSSRLVRELIHILEDESIAFLQLVNSKLLSHKAQQPRLPGSLWHEGCLLCIGETKTEVWGFLYKLVRLRQRCGCSSTNWFRLHVCIHTFFFFFGTTAHMPQGVIASPLTKFLDHTHNDAPQSVELLWTRDQLVAETSTWQHTTITTDIHAPVGFEPTIPTGDRPQTHALDSAVTGIRTFICKGSFIYLSDFASRVDEPRDL